MNWIFALILAYTSFSSSGSGISNKTSYSSCFSINSNENLTDPIDILFPVFASMFNTSKIISSIFSTLLKLLN